MRQTANPLTTQSLVGVSLLAMAVFQSKLMRLNDRYREQAHSYKEIYPAHQIADKKKPDLAKAFNRATALRSKSAKGGSMRVEP
ncbi:hypothetical protein [Pseudomonas sp. SWRI99]|uniref:hypothetical protein n=1 Tax=Pseudomonas sp. SWRI99 TaxID=2745506 RepID=UPI001647CA89|nr:hypothetical protein [Pseudomonas sp. SWRI99]MBC3774973.1 hypothetical protein [Pseudomonas sp. SWRI99]